MRRHPHSHTGLRSALLAGILLLASGASAEAKTYQEIELTWPNASEIEVIRSFSDLEVIRIEKGESVRFLSTPEMTQGLIDAGLHPVVAIEDAVAHHMGARTFAAGLGAFYSFSEAVSFLDSIHAAYPEITTAKESIGASVEGRTIWAIKISDNPELDEGEPEVLFDALHHAREPMGISILFEMMRRLCANYGTDPEATFLVNEREIWFVPVVNPDGYVWNELSGGTDMMWRKNRRDNVGTCEGVDLNRNWGYQWGGAGSSGDPCQETYRGTSAFSEPETQALRDFILSHDFVTHDSYHSYAALVLYPWGYTTAAAPDDATFAAIAAERVRDNAYTYGPAGSTLYLASGGTFDWAYGQEGVITYTTEVGGSWFWPETSEIPGLIAENQYSNLYLALAAGAYVRLASAEAAGGNENGRLDPGETAQLLVTIENVGVLAEAAAAAATLRSDDAYVQIDDASSAFGTIAAGGTATNAGDLFTVTVDAAAPQGHVLEFRVEMTWGGGARNEETVTFPVGAPIAADDFESGNHGWSQDPSHTALTGAWALIDPNATAYQQGDDTTPDPGTICWVTGQNSSEGTDDVDGGVSALRSPVWDLSAYASVTLHLNYFHGQRDAGDDSGDFFRIDLSNNGGATFPASLTQIGDVAHAHAWTPLQVNLEERLPLTNQMVLRFQAADGTTSGDIVEAGIDDLVLLAGGAPNDPPAAPAPLSPADGDTAVPAAGLIVANAADPEADPLVYGFRVYADSLLTTVVASADAVQEGPSETAWNVTPVLDNGRYWWRAYADDGNERGPYSPASSFFVDVSTGAPAGAPAFALSPASPNPAPGGTTVRFLLPGNGRVRADVYDVNGRCVRQLVRGVYAAGAQSIHWDGRDQRGNESAPGVYFIRLRSGEKEKAVKVVLVR